MAYKLPVSPSPNLNTDQSILLYPHICFFEGTTLSLGRGTLFPFQVVGSPLLKGKYSFSFKPVSMPGMSENPPLKDQVCYGINLKDYNTNIIKNTQRLNLAWLLSIYKIAGKTEAQIRKSWEPGLTKFKAIRSKYLLYK
jgi:uncharacterized protein YbbC (DUF1343 family)